jgi:hypothetical protein
MMKTDMSAYAAIRKALRPIKRIANDARTRFVELPYLLRRPTPGTSDWLIRSEVAYGGLISGVARRKVSPLDHRSLAELAFGGMTGGDRMLHHGYAEIYAHYLMAFLDTRSLALAEFGILTGTGLAIWCDLFPTARVLGLDIDPTYFNANRATLVRSGAFARNVPEVHEYDQLVDGGDRLAEILAGKTLDIVIDDGLHSLDAIVRTWQSVRPHLSQRFVYFIEDYDGLLDQCGADFLGFECSSFGMMTVISAGVPRAGSRLQHG